MAQPVAADGGPTAATREPSARALAAEALATVGADPRRSIALADEAVRRSRTDADAGARSVALRAIGLARKDLGDLGGSAAALREGVRVAQAAGLRQEAAEARMTLAFVELTRGRVASALTLADAAATHLDGLPGARVRAQRALILQRCGRSDEALAEYAAALPVLR